jgi:hypothetical protein
MNTSLWIVIAVAIGVLLISFFMSLRDERRLMKAGIKPGLGSLQRVAQFILRWGADLDIDKNVQFTVYRPATIVPERWYALLAFAHLSKPRPNAPKDEPDPVKEVQRQAARILSDQPARYESTKLDRAFSVPRKGLLTFVPLIEGCEFNPPSQSVRWRKTVHKVEFEMTASASVNGREVEGQMTVYLGNIILTEVPLRINVDSQYVAPESQQAVFEAASAEPYRKIFASYSHKDTEIVEDFEDYVQALGDKYLRDVRTLRAGEIFSEELERMIREASVFQLFWSSNSMPSKFVRQEWEYALGLNRPKFIRPVYWEEPLPEVKPDLPPEALKRLHFYKFPRREEEARPAVSPPMPGEKAGGGFDNWITESPRYLKAPPADWPTEPPEHRSQSLAVAAESVYPPEPLRDVDARVYKSSPMPPVIALAFAVLVVSLVAGLAYIGYRIWVAPGPSPVPAPVASPSPTPTTMPTAATPTSSSKPAAILTPTSSPTPSETPTATTSPRVSTGPSAVGVVLDPTSRLKEKGDSGDYYLAVRNESPGVIRDVEISEHLPSDLEYVSSSPKPVRQEGSQLIVWRVGERGGISGNRTATIKVTVRLRRSLKSGESIATEQTISYADELGNRKTAKSVAVAVKPM